MVNCDTNSESQISLTDSYGYGVLCSKGQTVRFLLDRHDGRYMWFYIVNESSQSQESPKPPEPLYSRYSVNFASFIMKAPSNGWMSIKTEGENLRSFTFDAEIVPQPNKELYITGIFIEHHRIMEINWKASEQIINITIKLYKNATLLHTIASKVNATLTKLDWKIGDDLSGENFQIHIQDSNNSSLYDYSELISIDPIPFSIASYNILINIFTIGIGFIFINFSRNFKVKFQKNKKK